MKNLKKRKIEKILEKMEQCFPSDVQGKIMVEKEGRDVIVRVKHYRDFEELHHLLDEVISFGMKMGAIVYFINGEKVKYRFRDEEVVTIVVEKIGGCS